VFLITLSCVSIKKGLCMDNNLKKTMLLQTCNISTRNNKYYVYIYICKHLVASALATSLSGKKWRWPQILFHLTLPLSQFVSCLNALGVPPGAIARAAGCLHSVGDQRALPLQLENRATRCMHTWHIVTYPASYHSLRSIFGISLALLFGL
jgi:hypothetical protein